MPFAKKPFLLLGLCAVAGARSSSAQRVPTRVQPVTPSFFAGATGVYTGLNSSRNLSLTAGLDIAFLPAARIRPALEYRGMLPLDKGQVASLRNSLGGVRFSTNVSRFQPYINLLAGRGETSYANGGFQVPGKIVFYTQSSSNVFSLGGGTDIAVSPRLALKIDLQFQRYSSPVTASGHLYPKIGAIALVYTFHSRR